MKGRLQCSRTWSHPPRLIPLCLNSHHLLLEALRLTNPASTSAFTPVRPQLQAQAQAPPQVHQFSFGQPLPNIPGTQARITPSTLKVKVLHTHQFLRRIHRVSKTDESNERMVMERPAAKCGSRDCKGKGPEQTGVEIPARSLKLVISTTSTNHTSRLIRLHTSTSRCTEPSKLVQDRSGRAALRWIAPQNAPERSVALLCNELIL
ncbi:hypothetical protein CY34DRAFT_324555 [Suillus luteus UH-Slu-Lm8-n1]|uniref:Uncharacterized protein n=1 Tax=Suillus luteus UH-Slu-Lm8-n1 TaxID=930992 RepID=A0A0D0AZ73_9AGAM|nr:hypothetical protein CY34DRAFT_324555 [Suillus luteus UH-Slu-Lm8-n1]